MARLARLKAESCEAWYHLYASVAGKKGAYPLSDPVCTRKLIHLMRHYSSAYYCGVAAFSVMGNHYHLVARFEQPRKLSKAELWERALRLYPRSEARLKLWRKEKWARLEKRLFDVSEFMRSIQSAFGRWYNGAYNRKGRFWAERFKSTLLGGAQAALDAMLYVDLNPVRARAAKRPEEWEGSSVFFRELKKDGWLIALEELVECAGGEGYTDYKGLLYHRGAIPTKPGQAVLAEELLRQEKARGLKRQGIYLKRLRYFTDGLALGGESWVREQIGRLREAGQILRREHPTEQLDGVHFSLREQRSTFVPLH